MSCTSWAADHEGTVCHEQLTNQAPRSSQSTSAQTADPRSQERSFGEEKKQEGGAKSSQQISLPVENSVTALLQISLQRRRSQIAQITSHRRCPREKQKSRAAVDIWRFADSCKGDPIFSETRDLRILSALADPHFALPEFCRAGSMPSRSRTSRNLDWQIPKGRCRILWL